MKVPKTINIGQTQNKISHAIKLNKLQRSSLDFMTDCFLVKLFTTNDMKKKKKISHRQQGQLRGSSSHFSPSRRRGLNPIKLVSVPNQPVGRLKII